MTADRDIRSVSAPYENFLCPLPPAVDGVWMVCRSRANPGWACCWKCDNEALTVGPHTADAVAFVALAPEEGGQPQLAHELYAYKDRGGSPRLITGLGSVLWRWLGAHEDCLASACHVSAFDIITTVPSSSSGRTGDHPLVNVVSGVVAGSQEAAPTPPWHLPGSAAPYFTVLLRQDSGEGLSPPLE